MPPSNESGKVNTSSAFPPAGLFHAALSSVLFNAVLSVLLNAVSFVDVTPLVAVEGH